MIDTKTEIEIKEVVIKTLKEYGYEPKAHGQTKLKPIEKLDQETIEYMENKQCLVWLGSNKSGESQGVRCNQVYISKNGSLDVDQTFPFDFEEVFNIWEAESQGESAVEIYQRFDPDEVKLHDVILVIWCLHHGKFNHILRYVKPERYCFEFKKYVGRF